MINQFIYQCDQTNVGIEGSAERIIIRFQPGQNIETIGRPDIRFVNFSYPGLQRQLARQLAQVFAFSEWVQWFSDYV